MEKLLTVPEVRAVPLFAMEEPVALVIHLIRLQNVPVDFVATVLELGGHVTVVVTMNEGRECVYARSNGGDGKERHNGSVVKHLVQRQRLGVLARVQMRGRG